MKKILLKHLKLLNFCGIREGSYEFGEDLTTISASNGKGKSTIVNAINYVLFGTDAKGYALDIKTYDKDHNIIREIEHSAELTLRVIEPDDIPGETDEFVFKRSLSDKWQGEECKNTFKYYINDEVCTASEYKKCLTSILSESIFAWIVNPSRFLSEDWKTQRAFLQSLVGDITTADITHGDQKFDFVVESLKKQDIEKLLHHLRYKRSEIQKQLDEVPIRLQELSKTMPQAEDFDNLQLTLEELESDLANIDSKVNAIKNGAATQVKNEGIRHRLEFARKRVDEMTKSARKLSGDEEVRHGSDLINARTAQSKAQAMVEELQAKMKGFTETEIHLNEQMDEHKKNIKEVGTQYEETNAERWEWNDENSFCPHCGQALPIDKVAQMKKESLERFNERKSKRLKSLLDVADKIKKEHAQCKQLMEQMVEDRHHTTNQLVEAHKALKDAEAHLDEVEKENPRKYTEILNSKEEFRKVSEEIQDLEAELSKPAEGEVEQQTMLAELAEQRKPVEEKISYLRSRLATKETFDKIAARIEEVHQERITYINQLDELDQKLDIANEYNQLSCSILEDRVSEHFKFVRWSLFKSNLDGEKKPFCECYHDGVPYSRLNGAAKVNAGIDIAYTISQHYDVSAPMVLDECESNLHPISRGGQQIRLYVTNDQELKFDYPALAVME